MTRLSLSVTVHFVVGNADKVIEGQVRKPSLGDLGDPRRWPCRCSRACFSPDQRALWSKSDNPTRPDQVMFKCRPESECKRWATAIKKEVARVHKIEVSTGPTHCQSSWPCAGTYVAAILGLLGSSLLSLLLFSSI